MSSAPARKVVMVDVDGILADFTTAWVKTTKELTGVEITTDVRCWDWFRDRVSKEQESAIWEHVKASQRWWYDVPVLATDEEVRRVREADDRYDLYFVTSRVGSTARAQTSAWLRFHFDVVDPTVLISNRKGDIAAGLGARAAIDDKPEHARAIAEKTAGETASFLLDRPHNRWLADPGVVRVGCLLEFFDEVDRLKDKLK